MTVAHSSSVTVEHCYKYRDHVSTSVHPATHPLLLGLTLPLVDGLALLPGGVLAHLLLLGGTDQLAGVDALLLRHLTTLLLSKDHK